MRLTLSKLQQQGMELWNDPSITEMLFGGNAGLAKSFLLCILAVLDCRKHPGSNNYIFRRTSVSLKESTMKTLLEEVHPYFGIKPEVDYKLKDMGQKVVYENGSTISFRNLDFKPSDPDFASLGSVNIDNAFIDEAGELPMKEIVDAIRSRIGRGQYSQTHQLPGTLFLSCNPSQNFLRKEFYDPYEALGGGRFQKWEIGDTYYQGKKIPAYRCFLTGNVYDNPFISESYIERLKALPSKEKRRLLEGDWDYNDDADTLFPGECFKKALIHELPEPPKEEYTVPGQSYNGRPIVETRTVFNKVIGVDVADSGKDKTVVALVDNNVLLDLKAFTVDRDADKAVARLYAEELVTYATRYGFTPETARNIGIEENGVGQALCAIMESMGWRITRCTATAKSRSENYYNLYLDLDGCNLRIYDDLPDYELLKGELTAHTVNFDSGKPVVGSKDKIRRFLGRSPDRSDAVSWANYMRKVAPENNQRARFRIAKI